MPLYLMRDLETGKTENMILSVDALFASRVDEIKGIYEIDGRRYEQDYQQKFEGKANVNWWIKERILKDFDYGSGKRWNTLDERKEWMKRNNVFNPDGD